MNTRGAAAVTVGFWALPPSSAEGDGSECPGLEIPSLNTCGLEKETLLQGWRAPTQDSSGLLRLLLGLVSMATQDASPSSFACLSAPPRPHRGNRPSWQAPRPEALGLLGRCWGLARACGSPESHFCSDHRLRDLSKSWGANRSQSVHFGASCPVDRKSVV